MKGAEAAVTWKEVKGHAGNLEGKEMKEREGCPVAGCVASACKSVHRT